MDEEKKLAMNAPFILRPSKLTTYGSVLTDFQGIPLIPIWEDLQSDIKCFNFDMGYILKSAEPDFHLLPRCISAAEIPAE